MWVCTLCLCALQFQQPSCSVFVAPQTAAECAGPSSGSGDHPQQYYLHQFRGRYKVYSSHLTTDDPRGKALFPILSSATKKYLSRYRDSFISPRKTPGPLGTDTLQPLKASCFPALQRTQAFWGLVAPLVRFLCSNCLNIIYAQSVFFKISSLDIYLYTQCISRCTQSVSWCFAV